MTKLRPRSILHRALGAAAVALAFASLATPARAQRADTIAAGVHLDTARAPRRAPRAPVVDSTPRPPISPKRAFLYSLLVPGMGEARLNHPGAAAFFGGIEAFSLAMARNSAKDLHVAERFQNDSIRVGYPVECVDATASSTSPAYSGCGPVPGAAFDSTLVFNRYRGGRVGARRLHYEDWLAVLVFNHLISGADAFISAQLWDLPARVAVEPGATGGAALALKFRW